MGQQPKIASEATGKPHIARATAKVPAVNAVKAFTAVKAASVRATAKAPKVAKVSHKKLSYADRAAQLALQVSAMKITVEKAEKHSARVQASGVRLTKEIAEKRSQLD